MIIESSSNAKVKYWKKLKEKKERDKEGLFLIEGDHLLNEALKTGLVKEIIASDEKFRVDNIPFYLVSDAILKNISNQVSGTNVIAVVKKIMEKPIKGNVCILDDIQDPGNLGAIIRSALAFDIKNIILSEKTVDLYNEKVLRASEGMLFHLNIIRTDIKDIILKLKNDNYKIYGTNVRDGISPSKITFDNKCAIIIGNEGKGMDQYLENYCDKLLNIPISQNCESLNASIAASIIFYEINRKEE